MDGRRKGLSTGEDPGVRPELQRRTSPVAVNLYVASNISKASMDEISRWVIPFFLALVAALLLVTYIPALSLWLPDILRIR